jgi:8-oxo-dGTP diphosphatase
MSEVKVVKKSGGILIKDNKALVLRDRDEDTFFTPGGRIDQGETAAQTIIRELEEEISIIVKESDLQEFGTYNHPMGTDTTKMLDMTVFLIKSWSGEITPNNEIEELKWIDSHNVDETKLGSIFKEELLPRLLEQGLIT